MDLPPLSTGGEPNSENETLKIGKDLVSPGIKEKMEIFTDKRKAENSPEQQNLSKKDKKKLKDQRKSLRKQDDWEMKQAHLSPAK